MEVINITIKVQEVKNVGKNNLLKDLDDKDQENVVINKIIMDFKIDDGNHLKHNGVDYPFNFDIDEEILKVVVVLI